MDASEIFIAFAIASFFAAIYWVAGAEKEEEE